MHIDFEDVSPSASGLIDFMMVVALTTIIVLGVTAAAWIELEPVRTAHRNFSSARLRFNERTERRRSFVSS